MRHLPLFILLPLLAATGLGQTAPPTTPADAAAIEQLLKDLSHDDYHTREDAQKRLDHMTYKQRDLLARLAAQATDEEAKARLTARIQTIDEQIAVNPPPISVDLKDATLADVATALSRETGVIFESSASAKTSRFTLHAVDQPFFEVFRQLCLQHPLVYDAGNRGPRLSEGTGGANAMRYLQIQGGFAIAPINIERKSSVDPQRQPPQKIAPAKTTLALHLLVDPRIQVETMSSRLFSRLLDDQGNSLIDIQQLLKDEQLKVARNSGNDWGKTIDLVIPENAGTKIAAAKGTLVLGIAVLSQNISLDNLDARVNARPVIVGDCTVTVTKYATTEKQIQMSLSIARPKPAAGDAAPPPPQVSLEDANGLVLWKGNLTGSTLSISTAAPFATPVHLEFSLPNKIREIPFTYEFKDLPLP